MSEYLVRQYRPAFVTGFQNAMFRAETRDDILKAPWLDYFRHDGFENFSIEPYGPELIISAHYRGGEHWVTGFALPVDSEAEAPDGGLLRDNWRYRGGGDECPHAFIRKPKP